MKNFKVGNEIIIKAKIAGLGPNHKGIITIINGEYHLVLPKGRKKGEEVELYYNEMKKIKKNQMKIKDLKIALNRYNDDDLILIQIGIGTAHRIEKGQISPAEHDSDLFPILKPTHDKMSNSLILELE
jgi:hypothetical protein